MKRISMLLTGIFLAASLITSYQPARAQSGKSTNPQFSSMIANEKVAATFNKMYADATNIKWSKDEHNNDLVYCKNGGKVIRAAFNRKGQFLYSIVYYGEEQLPPNILLMVKKAYYGRSIASVNEVNYAGKTAYLVNLEDRTSWLKIKVLDGSMTEEEFFLKSK